MTWALVIMLCQRVCVPQYAELHESRTDCVEKVDKNTSVFTNPRSYCIPIVKENK